ncbi:hypothetical protein M885DRAFT_615339 [Pelagophyceae sp. CCMP2097]|nr:hypothetical protein M885DRAFT_615339 [Pelagophyceae sp. CCMP2097]
MDEETAPVERLLVTCSLLRRGAECGVPVDGDSIDLSWEDDDGEEDSTHRVVLLVLTDGVYVVGVNLDKSLFVADFDAAADDWTWPDDHPAGPAQAKCRDFPAAAVAFAAKIFSNDSECQLKFDGKILTLGKRLLQKQKTCIFAMINHTHRTAFTTAHIAKLKEAEGPVATFLGMPSPALVAHVGKPISGTEAVVDAFGFVFFNHSQLLNRDSARSVFHNTMERHFYDSLREAGIFVRREVLDLFTDLMTPAQRADFWRRYPNSRSRHGCIPDILFEDGGVRRLADVKTMGFGETNYGETRLRHVVGPVDERARKVHVEYVRKVKALGRRDVAGDQDRFVQRLLELTGVTVGLVLGYFGEASSAVHQLVGKCAEGIAEANWEEMGAVCRADAVASQKRRLYGEWGIAAQREIARIRLGGLRWLGRGVYYPAGAVHAASDARQDARKHAYERASGPNVHGGGGDAFVGRG